MTTSTEQLVEAFWKVLDDHGVEDDHLDIARDLAAIALTTEAWSNLEHAVRRCRNLLENVQTQLAMVKEGKKGNVGIIKEVLEEAISAANRALDATPRGRG